MRTPVFFGGCKVWERVARFGNVLQGLGTCIWWLRSYLVVAIMFGPLVVEWFGGCNSDGWRAPHVSISSRSRRSALPRNAALATPSSYASPSSCSSPSSSSGSHSSSELSYGACSCSRSGSAARLARRAKMAAAGEPSCSPFISETARDAGALTAHLSLQHALCPAPYTPYLPFFVDQSSILLIAAATPMSIPRCPTKKAIPLARSRARAPRATG